MDHKEYLRNVYYNFDVEESIKAAVWTAQWFVDMGLLDEDQAIREFKLTKALYLKYKTVPQS